MKNVLDVPDGYVEGPCHHWRSYNKTSVEQINGIWTVLVTDSRQSGEGQAIAWYNTQQQAKLCARMVQAQLDAGDSLADIEIPSL